MTRTDVMEHIASEYGVTPDYPFSGDDEICVFRHRGNGKWFALAMKVAPQALGLAGDGRVDILNVKSDPLLISSLRRQEGFHPAYHMNKRCWITARLDGAAPRDVIAALIEQSYALTAPKALRKSARNAKE